MWIVPKEHSHHADNHGIQIYCSVINNGCQWKGKRKQAGNDKKEAGDDFYQGIITGFLFLRIIEEFRSIRHADGAYA